MNTFDNLYRQLMEMNIAGMGGVFGSNPDTMNHGGDVGNKDYISPNDSRVPKILGKINRRIPAPKRSKRKK